MLAFDTRTGHFSAALYRYRRQWQLRFRDSFLVGRKLGHRTVCLDDILLPFAHQQWEEALRPLATSRNTTEWMQGWEPEKAYVRKDPPR